MATPINPLSEAQDARPPVPGRRPWSWGEIAAWAVILIVVAVVAWRAVVMQMRQAEAIAPEISLRMMSQYAVVMHVVSGSGGPQGAEVDAKMLDQLDRAAKLPVDRFRVAVVAGEILGRDQALTRMEALVQEDQALAGDVGTARAVYHGDNVPEETWAAFRGKYQWYADLLAGAGPPAGKPQHDRALRAAYITVTVLGGGFLAVAGLTVAGLVLLIIAIVRLAQRRIRLAYSRADVPGNEPADRRAYLYGMALYMAAYIGLAYSLRLVLGDMPLPEIFGLLGLTAAFVLGASCPLLMGQTWRQWRLTLGLHSGRGVWREIGSGIVGYLAGMPLLVAGMVLVYVLTRISGIKGAHPIVQDLQGSPWELALAFFMACVFAPVTEELMFRGALFASLRERCNWWIAAPVMAVIFGLIHPQSWVALPALAAIAVVLAGIREWRGSIIGCITAHALHNGAALAVTVLLLR